MSYPVSLADPEKKNNRNVTKAESSSRGLSFVSSSLGEQFSSCALHERQFERGEGPVVKEAMWALANIVEGGTPQQIVDMTEMGGIHGLMENIANTDRRTLSVALKCQSLFGNAERY